MYANLNTISMLMNVMNNLMFEKTEFHNLKIAFFVKIGTTYTT